MRPPHDTPAHWTLVRELFEAALALPSHQRDDLLVARCGDDDGLLEEVRSLLRAAEDTSPGILERLGDRIPRAVDVLREAAPPDRVGPYRVLGEAGRGGMGVVYRAHDPRLRRSVALKFLPGSLVRDPLARARLVQEARAASALDHPNICTIHDVGSTEDGRLFIAMAWYGGGTLADRLRSGALPGDEAARIARQVAEALHRAHEAGIVHRDVKPANVAFGDAGEAKVLDFGIAAVESAGVVDHGGTPRYMAPEQLRGAPFDRRADIWSLGAVLHEMLTGEAPYDGENPEAVLRSIEERGPPKSERIPRSLGGIVRRALAPEPGRRFETAAEMSESIVRATAPGAAGHGHRRNMRLALGALALVLALATLPLVRRAWSDGPALDPDAVAVLPFRVSGDPSLHYLREGMVDLLSAKLPGAGGLRASDARAVTSAWRRLAGSEDVDPTGESALAVARAVRASRVLLGDVVGTPGGMIVNAALIEGRGKVVARASARGSRDELADLVDRLVAELLSLNAGEEPTRVSSLTSTSLPALRWYLEGQAAYRRGRYEDALVRYARALDVDSTFALAGLGMELASGWVGGVTSRRERGRAVAWQNRGRMSRIDRALLVAAVGPQYPRRSSTRQKLEAVDDALRMAPDRVELWYLQADALFHYGRVLGAPDWETRAQAGFGRAMELDPSFAAPAHHLILLHARRGDIAGLGTAVTLRLAQEPEGPTADFVRWLAAVKGAPGFSRTPRLDSMTVEALGWVAIITQDEGFAIEDGRIAVELLLERPGTRAERLERLLAAHAWQLNAGRPQRALAITESVSEVQPDPSLVHRLRVLDALWADGDQDAGTAAAAALLAGSGETDATGPLNRCVADQWLLIMGRPAGAPVVAAVPTTLPGEAPSPALEVCAAVVAAIREVAVERRQTGDAASRLQRLLSEGPFEGAVADGHLEYLSRALAYVYERAGDPAAALDALSRRLYFLGWQSDLAAGLRDEARLATALGDTARAVRVSEHYLALRGSPEPSLSADVAQVRSSVTALRAPSGR